MASLTNLKNIGPVSAARLEAVGIRTAEDLAEVGVVEAYWRLKAVFPRVTSLLMLYALQGGLLDIHWNALPPEMKESLQEQIGAKADTKKPKRRIKK